MSELFFFRSLSSVRDDDDDFDGIIDDDCLPQVQSITSLLQKKRSLSSSSFSFFFFSLSLSRKFL